MSKEIDDIIQIIPNDSPLNAAFLEYGKKVKIPIVCWGLRKMIWDKGTEDEFICNEVVGMIMAEELAALEFVDEEQNDKWKFIGYE